MEEISLEDTKSKSTTSAVQIKDKEEIQKIVTLKRTRNDISEESSQSSDECFSPEIKYTGPPVRYKLSYKEDGQSEIVREIIKEISE